MPAYQTIQCPRCQSRGAGRVLDGGAVECESCRAVLPGLDSPLMYRVISTRQGDHGVYTREAGRFGSEDEMRRWLAGRDLSLGPVVIGGTVVTVSAEYSADGETWWPC